MTDPATIDESAHPAAPEAANQAASVEPTAPAAVPAATNEAAGVEAAGPPAASEGAHEATSGEAAAPPAAAGRKKKQPPPRSSIQPVLEQLASLHPQLFGAVFRPLKRGIFQDLLDAHPGAFEREALKDALGFHTRSTRYLTAVAAGQQRHDLEGKPVEAMAPEHVHHALLEVFRRRQGRGGEDLRPRLRDRIVQAFEASGLSREDYAQLVRGRDEAANALLDEALAIAAERMAKDEALLRAFDASGRSVEDFAEMYGLDARVAARSLERARRLKAAAPVPTAVG
jgi:sRNA-binding protein